MRRPSTPETSIFPGTTCPASCSRFKPAAGTITEVEAGLDPGEHFGMCRALRGGAALISVHRGRQSDAEAHLTAAAAATDSSTFTWFYEYLRLCADALADEARGHSERAYARLTAAFDRGVGHLPGQLILGFLTPDLVRLALTHNDTTNARRYAEAARRRADHSGTPYHLGDALRCQGRLGRDPGCCWKQRAATTRRRGR